MRKGGREGGKEKDPFCWSIHPIPTMARPGLELQPGTKCRSPLWMPRTQLLGHHHYLPRDCFLGRLESGVRTRSSDAGQGHLNHQTKCPPLSNSTLTVIRIQTQVSPYCHQILPRELQGSSSTSWPLFRKGHSRIVSIGSGHRPQLSAVFNFDACLELC